MKAFLIIYMASACMGGTEFCWNAKRYNGYGVESVAKCMSFKKDVEAHKSAEITITESGRQIAPTSLGYSAMGDADWKVICLKEQKP